MRSYGLLTDIPQYLICGIRIIDARVTKCGIYFAVYPDTKPRANLKPSAPLGQRQRGRRRTATRAAARASARTTRASDGRREHGRRQRGRRQRERRRAPPRRRRGRRGRRYARGRRGRHVRGRGRRGRKAGAAARRAARSTPPCSPGSARTRDAQHDRAQPPAAPRRPTTRLHAAPRPANTAVWRERFSEVRGRVVNTRFSEQTRGAHHLPTPRHVRSRCVARRTAPPLPPHAARHVTRLALAGLEGDATTSLTATGATAAAAPPPTRRRYVSRSPKGKDARALCPRPGSTLP